MKVALDLTEFGNLFLFTAMAVHKEEVGNSYFPICKTLSASKKRAISSGLKSIKKFLNEANVND